MTQNSKRKFAGTKAVQIGLATAGGLSVLLGNATFVKNDGVIFGKSLTLGISQAHATCIKEDGKVICGCSSGCGVR